LQAGLQADLQAGLQSFCPQAQCFLQAEPQAFELHAAPQAAGPQGAWQPSPARAPRAKSKLAARVKATPNFFIAISSYSLLQA
jgi:hypothetical protein